MSPRLTIVAFMIGGLLVVELAGIWAVGYLLFGGDVPPWAIVLLAVASIGCVHAVWHFFRRQCLWAEAYVYALRQGAPREDARAVASRYVDVRLPWGRPSADARRVLREAETMTEEERRAAANSYLHRS